MPPLLEFQRIENGTKRLPHPLFWHFDVLKMELNVSHAPSFGKVLNRNRKFM